jgi:hypothetical protein
VEVDVVDFIIIAGADNNGTTNRATTSTITCPVDLQLLDASMETSTLVATMEEVAAMVGALVLYAALPGTRPSSALRQVNASVPLPKEIVV